MVHISDMYFPSILLISFTYFDTQRLQICLNHMDRNDLTTYKYFKH